jgi:hypothetical protein
VVQAEDEVLLDGPGVRGVGLGAGEHAQVVARQRKVGARRHRIEPVAEAVDGGDQRRDGGAQREGLVPALVGVHVEEGCEPEGGGVVGQAGAEGRGHRVAVPSDPRQGPQDCRRQGAEGRQLLGEVPPTGLLREVTVEQQVPHVLEGPVSGEVRRRVLAVVVEALVATDVAEVGLGDDEALQARWCVLWVRGGGHGRIVPPAARMINIDRINAQSRSTIRP